MTTNKITDTVSLSRAAYAAALDKLVANGDHAIGFQGSDADFLRFYAMAELYDVDPVGAVPFSIPYTDIARMATYYHGSLAGIALTVHWTSDALDDIASGPDYELRDRVVETATEILGMSEQEGLDFFLEHRHGDAFEEALLSGNIRYSHAAGTFRRYIDEGVVDWNASLGQSEEVISGGLNVMYAALVEGAVGGDSLPDWDKLDHEVRDGLIRRCSAYAAEHRNKERADLLVEELTRLGLLG